MDGYVSGISLFFFSLFQGTATVAYTFFATNLINIAEIGIFISAVLESVVGLWLMDSEYRRREAHKGTPSEILTVHKKDGTETKKPFQFDDKGNLI